MGLDCANCREHTRWNQGSNMGAVGNTKNQVRQQPHPHCLAATLALRAATGAAPGATAR